MSGVLLLSRSVARTAESVLQIISVLEVDESGWWKGIASSGAEGWFPSNYIERMY